MFHFFSMAHGTGLRGPQLYFLIVWPVYPGEACLHRFRGSDVQGGRIRAGSAWSFRLFDPLAKGPVKQLPSNGEGRFSRSRVMLRCVSSMLKPLGQFRTGFPDPVRIFPTEAQARSWGKARNPQPLDGRQKKSHRLVVSQNKRVRPRTWFSLG